MQGPSGRGRQQARLRVRIPAGDFLEEAVPAVRLVQAERHDENRVGGGGIDDDAVRRDSNIAVTVIYLPPWK